MMEQCEKRRTDAPCGYGGTRVANGDAYAPGQTTPCAARRASKPDTGLLEHSCSLGSQEHNIGHILSEGACQLLRVARHHKQTSYPWPPARQRLPSRVGAS